MSEFARRKSTKSVLYHHVYYKYNACPHAKNHSCVVIFHSCDDLILSSKTSIRAPKSG